MESRRDITAPKEKANAPLQMQPDIEFLSDILTSHRSWCVLAAALQSSLETAVSSQTERPVGWVPLLEKDRMPQTGDLPQGCTSKVFIQKI